MFDKTKKFVAVISILLLLFCHFSAISVHFNPRSEGSFLYQNSSEVNIKMHTYYIAGVPYSDELYHHGILGQKWGIRRFQNPDGSLTALGKIHYGAQEVGKKIRSTTSKVAKNIVNRKIEEYKEKHPNKMTDAELRDKINRIQMENQYREMMRQNNKPISVGRKIALDILETSTKSLASGLINRLNREWEEDAAYDRRVEYEKRDQKRAETRDKKTMSYKFDKYVEKTLPKKFSDFKQEDWENFDTFTNIKNRIREYEGGGQGKKNQKGKK